MAATEEDRTATAAGRGVDAQGGPVIDPSQNVLDLVRAEARRQDDLRQVVSQHTRAVVALHAEHAKELRKAEADRVDALRAGDQAAIQAQAAKVDATAATLAATVAAAAEAMRASQAAQAAQFTNALDELRRFQYGQQGGTAKGDRDQVTKGTMYALGGVIIAALAIVVAVVNVAVSR